MRVLALATLVWLSVASSFALGDEPGVAGPCLGSASTALALREGRAARLGQVARPFVGDILHADLCQGENGLVYRVVVIDELGRVRRVVLDALTGRLVYDGRGRPE